MKRQPFYAVRIVITDTETGSTSTRDYVRGEERMGIEKFGKWALGDMIALVSDGQTPITWEIHALEPQQVYDNRRYHHTTHTEG